jgi:hypothetical protein
MLGQGRPPRRLLRALEKAVAPSLLVVLWFFALGHSVLLQAAETVDVRIRIAWGGGEARSWLGTIRVSEGTVSEVQPLGLEADVPGSMLLADPATVRVIPRSPRGYHGCDLRVQAPEDAKLLVQLDWESPPRRAPIELPLIRVMQELMQQDLDDKSNRLLAQRSPGDTLRVNFNRSSLVFATGEKFELEVQPQELELAANGSYVLSATLGPARTEDIQWSEEKEIQTDSAGRAKGLPLTLSVPEAEGVYDLRLALFPKRLTPALLRGKPLASRKVQLVAVSPVKTAQPPPAAWQSVLEFDPANPKWWEQVARLPAWTRLPTTPRPVESRPASVRVHQGRNWVELAPRAWQAYPLSMPAVGRPHLVEIEYPSDIEQTLSISIVEPNSAGYVGPVGLDSGLEVSRPDAGHQPGVKRHEIVVWPQTRAPYLLLVNRRDDAAAVFGRIGVKAGPSNLTPLAIPSAVYPTRQLTAYFDKPLFAENFSGSEAVDPVTRRSLDDWITFGSAAERLIETLQQGGYSSLMLTVASDGSAIYPSKLLEPTPEYDSGVFFESGQDPLRKDILEMLFRLCDRSGIVLIPAVQFAGPLPELERARLAGEGATGLEPVGPDGKTWMSRGGALAGAGVYYNPLDERVQRAMVAVVDELAQRYGHHASFGGISIHMSADSYAMLPDGTCSLDEMTFSRFLAESKTPAAAQDLASAAARWEFVRSNAGPAWMEWRTERMSALFRQMRATISQQRLGAKLYLTPANLLGGRQLQSALRPELPPYDGVAERLPLLGLDIARLNDVDIVVPRPQRVTSMSTPSAHDQDVHWNRNAALDSVFTKATQRAAVHYVTPAPLRLPDFDAVSPFGADKTRTLLVSHIVPADAAYRERFVESLARLDAAVMIDGGWMLPLGQHSALSPLTKVYRRLPSEAFETISQTGQPQQRGSQPQECVVRTLNKGDKTFFYVANPTPWPLTVQIQFAAAQAPRITPYNDERATKTQQMSGGQEWTVTLEPFDLVGGEVAGGQARVVKWSVTPPANAAAALGEQSREVARRANYLRENPRAVTLFNPSFEIKAVDGSPAGWQHARGDGLAVTVESRPASVITDALHLVRRGAHSPLWVRSTPINAPTTGRVQMTARIRLADGAPQPQLRLAIEGKLDGQPFYRRANFGAAEAAGMEVSPLTPGQWTAHTIELTDLPTAGLTDLCVGFDLMSDGEVWIDDVQVQDLWLDVTELDELKKSVATANLQAQSGSLNEARLFVEGYWPSFLRRNVQLPDAVVAPPNAAGANAPRKPLGGLSSILPSAQAATKEAKETKEGKEEKNKRSSRTAERLKSWLPSSWPWK